MAQNSTSNPPPSNLTNNLPPNSNSTPSPSGPPLTKKPTLISKSTAVTKPILQTALSIHPPPPYSSTPSPVPVPNPSPHISPPPLPPKKNSATYGVTAAPPYPPKYTSSSPSPTTIYNRKSFDPATGYIVQNQNPTPPIRSSPVQQVTNTEEMTAPKGNNILNSLAKEVIIVDKVENNNGGNNNIDPPEVNSVTNSIKQLLFASGFNNSDSSKFSTSLEPGGKKYIPYPSPVAAGAQQVKSSNSNNSGANKNKREESFKNLNRKSKSTAGNMNGDIAANGNNKLGIPVVENGNGNSSVTNGSKSKAVSNGNQVQGNSTEARIHTHESPIPERKKWSREKEEERFESKVSILPFLETFGVRFSSIFPFKECYLPCKCFLL